MDKLEDLINDTCEYLNVDLEKFMTDSEFRGTIGEYRYGQKLFNVIKNIKEGKEDLAWDYARELVEVVLEGKRLERMDSKSLYETGLYLVRVSSFLEIYDKMKEEFSGKWKQELLSISLLSDEEKNRPALEKEYPFSLKEKVNKILRSGEIKISRLQGSDSLPLVYNTEISGSFIMTDHTSELVKSIKCFSDDKVRIYIMLNIDQILDFSYFLIVINFHSSIWVVSDEPKFANPEAKMSIASRGAARFRQNNFDKTIFPYKYIDVIEELRKDEKNITTEKNRVELYNIPLKEWPTVCRIMFHFFINEVLLDIVRQPDLTLVSFVSEHLANNTKLLQPTNLENLTDENSEANVQAGIADVVNDLRFRTIHPVKADSEIVKSNISLFSNNLMSRNQYDELASWAERKDIFKKMEAELEVTDSEKEADIKEMNRLISQNLDNVLPTILGYSRIIIFVLDKRVKEYKDDSVRFRDGMPFVESNLKDGSVLYSFNLIGVFGETCGICTKCGKSHINSTHHTNLRVVHHAVLSWLSGVTRNELPFYFRNYMSYSYWPYYGNPLLDNVNPLHRLQDKLSIKSPNGILFRISMCKRCRNKIVKDIQDEIYIVIDHETGKEVERIDRETFNLKYKQKK